MRIGDRCVELPVGWTGLVVRGRTEEVHIHCDGKVDIHGAVNKASTESGSLHVTGNVANAKTVSGNITVHGDVSRANSVSGNVVTRK